MSPPSCSPILGIPVHAVTTTETLALVERYMAEPRLHQIATVNPEFVMAAQTDAAFRHALQHGRSLPAGRRGVALRRATTRAVRCRSACPARSWSMPWPSGRRPVVGRCSCWARPPAWPRKRRGLLDRALSRFGQSPGLMPVRPTIERERRHRATNQRQRGASSLRRLWRAQAGQVDRAQPAHADDGARGDWRWRVARFRHRPGRSRAALGAGRGWNGSTGSTRNRGAGGGCWRCRGLRGG